MKKVKRSKGGEIAEANLDKAIKMSQKQLMADLLRDVPKACECDNTHEANETVCRFCWNKGIRYKKLPLHVPGFNPPVPNMQNKATVKKVKAFLKKETKPKSYLVTWRIDIEAENEIEAAKQALNIQRQEGSEATYFEVKDKTTKKIKDVDLQAYDF